MKIEFTKLPTTDGTIKISLDGGQSFTEHNLADVHESGISLSDDQDFEKIRIKGPANVLKNLDVISSINTLYESNLLPEDITGLVLKDFNGTFDKSLLQKYPNLTNVTIPNSVTSIGSFAFQNCSKLTINYTGTDDQWKAITKGSNWNSNCPSDMVINYNYQGE